MGFIETLFRSSKIIFKSSKEVDLFKKTLLKTIKNDDIYKAIENLKINKKFNKLFINNYHIETILKDIFNGNIISFFHKINVKNITLELYEYIQMQTKNSIHFHVEKISSLSTSLKSALPELKNFKKFNNKSWLLLKNNKKFNKIIEYISKNKLKIIGFTSATTIGALTIHDFLKEYQETISGCIKYEVKNDKIESCKMIPYSCWEKKVSIKMKACNTSLLTLPPNLLNDCNEKSKEPCFNCNDAILNNTNNPNIYFRCKQYDLLETLADFTHDHASSILSEINQVTTTVWDNFKLIFSFGKYIIIFIFLVIIIKIIMWAKKIIYKPKINYNYKKIS
ncbi:hypothetical protein LbFV_ORF43 [Leptopilina boulardi filamentous virus]|uniref:Uncharacterized protein n=1 Tax=Leptopilina boulardi filamentous virus TaxID=552509 RepID=A0A1S5YD31_9VIRU|nr:hypothetical protein LbFV_ORF43 [Leptopilina boulardi filamentous virus]AQQ79963.1 hypothetical protein LbFV_ORF43 [Leptopilina boulardi filamentous virus]